MVPPNISMKAPATILPGTQVLLPDGTAVIVDANSLISISALYATILVNAGWTFAGAEQFTNITLTGLLTESSVGGITAFAGGGQASATPLTLEINRISTVATAGDSVKLPTAAAGLTILVINSGANPMQVFGTGTDTIDGNLAATGVSQMQNSVVLYICAVAGAWQTEGLSTGFSGSLQTLSATNAITAFATGGQASAVQLSSLINRVSVCATAGDSAKLPVSAPGLSIVVINDGAASCNVFGQTGDTINSLAANSAFAVPAGQTVTFNSTVAGAWQTTPAQLALPTKFTLNAGAGPLVASAGDLTGANDVVAQYSGVNASTLTVRTAAQMIADAALKVGQSFRLRIINTAAGTATLTTATGVTLTGKVAILTNTYVDYVVTVTGAATMTFQSVGSGTAP